MKILFVALGLLPLSAAAQLPVVDITSVTTVGDQIEVRIRPDAFFDEYFSSIVFTIRWDEFDGATLGSVVTDPAVMPYASIAKSGPETASGAYRYQIFAGFGNINTLAAVGSSWPAEQEIVLCRVNLGTGTSLFQLANDAWTDANNGTYYISLNGVDRTGQIYTFTTGLGGSMDDARVSVMPNPTPNGVFQVDLDAEMGTIVDLVMHDALGRQVWSRTGVAVQGSPITVSALSGMADGMYMLTVHGPAGPRSQRIVLDRP